MKTAFLSKNREDFCLKIEFLSLKTGKQQKSQEEFQTEQLPQSVQVNM